MNEQPKESHLTTFAWAAGALVIVGAMAFYVAG